MADEPRDPWKLPALDRLGVELSRLETEGPAADTATAKPRRSRRLILVPSGVAAIVAALVLALNSGGPAGANSVINRAPAAAIRSAAVQFRSSIAISVGHRTLRRFAQSGGIDFASGAYQATFRLVGTTLASEVRSVGGVLYFADTSSTVGRTTRPRWTAARLSAAQQRALGSAPESDAITDPLAVLRVLANTHAPVSRIGASSTDGIPTTQYRASTDLYSILSASGQTNRIPTAYRTIGATLDVWLDHKGRPRRVLETFTEYSPRSVELRVALAFFGYGVPVAVVRPKAAEPNGTLRTGPPAPLVGGPSHIFESLLARPAVGP
jgi:hypothetical protein